MVAEVVTAVAVRQWQRRRCGGDEELEGVRSSCDQGIECTSVEKSHIIGQYLVMVASLH